jgi:hypothetical protein
MPYNKYSVWTTKEVAYIENKRFAIVDNYMFPNASEIVRGIRENNNMFINNCSRLTTEIIVIWTKSLTNKTGKKGMCNS